MLRKPVAAGMFYPSEPGELKRVLESLFAGTPKGESLGAVSPHAGYPYSGKGCAFAVNSLKEAGSFIILGPNHTGLGKRFSINSDGGWETPLGAVRIDSSLAGKLKNACPLLEEDSLAHLQEHSIEVQLPFLQHRFRDFRFVPICMMSTGYSQEFMEECQKLGEAIVGAMSGGGVAVIASSDFSHHIPAGEAERIDSRAVKEILGLDLEGFFRVLKEEHASVCGFGPIAVLMAAAKSLGLKGRLLHSCHSGDVTGDNQAVVGYRAIGFG